MVNVLTVLNCIFSSPKFDIKSTFVSPPPYNGAEAREQKLRTAAEKKRSVGGGEGDNSNSDSDSSDDLEFW